VHTAFYQGEKVAIKVQRAGLKELFDVDLKNLKKLAELLDKFDPKSDGADRDWVAIYDESARLLYEEIDYLNEAKNAERFREQFKDTPWCVS
jgi:predicted unusual protein kinase regulating ubiquinone biosynthesis (AarF/ABC1/UbiB family)